MENRPSACPLECPGCDQLGWSRADSDGQKQDWLKRALAPWADRIVPIRGPGRIEDRWGYRRKSTLRASRDADRWKLGLLKKARWEERVPDEVIDIPECPVHAPEVRARFDLAARSVPLDWPLHAVMVAGELLTLVLKAAQAPADALPWAAQVDWTGVGLKGVSLNLHPSAGNRVLSAKHWVRIWGEAHAGSEGDWYGPSAFQQLIPELYRDALGRARDFIAPGPRRDVIDLCSGTGQSIAVWRQAGAESLGVELSGEAVSCAELNGVHCLRGKASERIPQLNSWLDARQVSRPSTDWVVFANPPRLGLEPEVVQWLGRRGPARIAYLSCSAGSLRRDLDALSQSGFEVESILPYDFFPQTSHVETLALLTRTAPTKVN